MKILNKVTQWITKNPNDPILAFISLTLPSQFLRTYYNSSEKTDWGDKKACISISFDCDSVKDIEQIPMILDHLSSLSILASFACIGKFIERYPSIHKRMINEGHEIINHTYTHPNNSELDSFRKFNELSMEEIRKEIEKCDEVCKRILGYSPIGFRVPHFKRLFTSTIYPVLHKLGYKYSSSVMAIGSPNYGYFYRTEEGLLEFPLSNCPLHLFACLDTYHELRSNHWIYKFLPRGRTKLISSFKKLLDIGIETGAYLNIYLDPQDLIDVKILNSILYETSKNRDKLIVAPYFQLVDRFN